MKLITRRRSATRGLFVVCLGLLAFAGPAAAEDECRTWFPDLDPECERKARPDGTVMPMSFPYIFEDPYITSGLNFVTIWHEFPEGSVFGGGDLWVLALQARIAITDRVAFIATKDGVGFLDPDNPALDEETGFFNLSFGLKAKAWEYQDENQSAIITPSLRYEAPAGDRDVLQGHDDGMFIPAVTSAYQNGPWHVIFGIGGHIPVDSDENSSNVFYNLHLSHAFPAPGFADNWLQNVVPFIELNGIHWDNDGNGSRRVGLQGGTSVPIGAVAAGFEGVDVINLGNNGVGGNDYITMAWGLRFPMDLGLSFGMAYERPLSNRKDITEQRFTMMLTWEF